MAWGSRVFGDVELGDYVYIGPGSDVRGRVIIGRGTRLNGENYVRAGPGDDCPIIIGAYNAIAPRASFFARDHDISDLPLQTWLRKRIGLPEGFKCRGGIIVGNDVWIGYGAVLLSGTRVGDGAVIGAMSVVRGEVEPYSIAVGVPARPVKKRFSDDVIQCLEESRWWELPPGPRLREAIEQARRCIGKAATR